MLITSNSDQGIKISPTYGDNNSSDTWKTKLRTLLKLPYMFLRNDTFSKTYHFAVASVSSLKFPGRLKVGLHPRSLTAKTPEKWWLEDDPFLLGPGNFSGASC